MAAEEFIRARTSSFNVRTRGPRRVGAAMVATYKFEVQRGVNPPPSITNEAFQYWLFREQAGDQITWPVPNKLPTINRSIFLWGADNANGWQAYPWLICSDIQLQRDPNNARIYNVEATYSVPEHIAPNTDEVIDYPSPMPTSVDEYPLLRRSVWDEEDKIIYEEADYGTGATTLEFRLPTGSYFSEPFRRKHPIRHLRQTQFEVLGSDVNGLIEERLFSMQDRQYLGYPAGGTGDMVSNRDSNTPPRWMIGGIEYQPVLLPIDNAGTIELISAYMMTYDLQYTIRDGGWYDRRALVDNFVLTQANDLTTKTEYRSPRDGVTIIDALLEKTGVARPDQNGAFAYNNYQEQPFGVWSFLKGTAP